MLLPEELAAYEQLIDVNRITLHYAAREDFERHLAGLFTIEAVRDGNDYPCSDQHPVYLMRRTA